MPERDTQRKEPIPNVRGEDENELQYLAGMIESKYFVSLFGRFKRFRQADGDAQA